MPSHVLFVRYVEKFLFEEVLLTGSTARITESLLIFVNIFYQHISIVSSAVSKSFFKFVQLTCHSSNSVRNNDKAMMDGKVAVLPDVPKIPAFFRKIKFELFN